MKLVWVGGLTVTVCATIGCWGGGLSDKTVIRGQELKLYNTLYSLNENCGSLGTATVRVLSPPKNGQIATKMTQDYPTYNQRNPRSVCNQKQLPGLNAFYTPNPGFVGDDQADLEVIWPDGSTDLTRFTVHVVP